MQIERAYKVELDPDNKQRTLLVKHAGVARFAFNWGLATCRDRYEQAKASGTKPGKIVDPIKLHKELNALKKTSFPWMYEVSKCAPQSALVDLGKAFDNFFRGCKKKRRVGYPKFKSKTTSRKSFRLGGAIRVETKKIKLPRLGWLRLKEASYVPLGAKIRAVTISEKAGRWYASVQVVEEKDVVASTSDQVIGIDLGIKMLAVCSNGAEFQNPKCLRGAHKKIKHLSRELSRRKKGSNNRRKTKAKLAKVHAKVAAARSDAIHKITTWVTKTKSPKAVVIEDLNIGGMVKNRCLSRAISDCGFRMLRNQLEYKCKWYGVELVVASRWFPSSKLCSCCGAIKKELKLDERTYICEACGLEFDRDLNAALNLEHYYAASTVVSACGENVRPLNDEAILREAGREHQSCSQL